MKYLVVEKQLVGDLIYSVMDLINEGWKPQGGVAYDSSKGYYIQAMIKETK